MDDNQAQQAPEQQYNDGSLSAAAAAMPDLPGFDNPNLVDFAAARDGLQQPQRPRDDAGRFAQAQPQQQTPPQAKPPEQQQAKPQQVEEAEKSEPGEEFFELPPETEGGEPVRIPASEVFEGYQKAKDLQAELEEAKRIAPPPLEYDKQIYETVRIRGQLAQELNAYAQLIQPQQPDMELLNPQSPRHNPEAFYQQAMVSRQMQEQLTNIRQRIQALNSEQQTEQEALSKARFARERGKLQEMWPEVLTSPQKATQVRDMAQRLYGIDNETFSQTIDARFYAVLKDALAFREGLKTKEAAVKVVRSKPKLVRASARTGADSARAQQVQTHYQRLTRSGSLDDAAEAIGGLLG